MGDLRIGVVGLGAVAGAHIETFKSVKGANVTTVCSRREHHPADLEKKYDLPLKPYSDFDAILYRPLRVGWNARLFRMYKFRTMRKDAEVATDPVWAQQFDSRRTRAGHFLRATNLDELPQLWNVFKGNMSLVGPRPERPHFVGQFK